MGLHGVIVPSAVEVERPTFFGNEEGHKENYIHHRQQTLSQLPPTPAKVRVSLTHCSRGDRIGYVSFSNIRILFTLTFIDMMTTLLI